MNFNKDIPELDGSTTAESSELFYNYFNPKIHIGTSEPTPETTVSIVSLRGGNSIHARISQLYPGKSLFELSLTESQIVEFTKNNLKSLTKDGPGPVYYFILRTIVDGDAKFSILIIFPMPEKPQINFRKISDHLNDPNSQDLLVTNNT